MSLRVFVNEPAAHVMQTVVDAVLYVPAVHAVHEVAPVSWSLSVTDPAAHAMQLVVDAVLYVPALQAVQELAPLSLSLLVIEPAEQAAQEDPGEENVPAAQRAQLVPSFP